MITAKIDSRNATQRLQSLQRNAADAGKQSIYLGFFSDARYDADEGGMLVADVARINNYGTITSGGYIPPRPFLTTSFHNNSNARQLKSKFKNVMQRHVAAGAALPTAYHKTLQAIALWARGVLQMYIKNYSLGPENAPSTIARKQKTPGEEVRPLTDTGHLAASVAYKIY